jgi:serine/threonine-protein kinase RsbW
MGGMAILAQTARRATLRLKLDCDLEAVRPAAHELRVFLGGKGCSEHDLRDIELAFVEACNNAILHADEGGRQKPVEVEAIFSKDRIELRVKDHTSGFALPERSDLPDPSSENGRGLYLIRSLVDAVEYQRGRKENTLVLKKERRGEHKL